MQPGYDLLEVGDVLIAGSFVVTPASIDAFERARELAAKLEMPGVLPVHATARRRAPGVPPQVLVGEAIRALQQSERLGGARMIVRDVRRVRELVAVVPGERLTCVANVVAVSRRDVDFVTLEVELRRRDGRVLSCVRLGIELGAPQAQIEPEDTHLFFAA